MNNTGVYLHTTARLQFEIWHNDRVRLQNKLVDLDNKINGFIKEARRLKKLKETNGLYLVKQNQKLK